MEDKRSKILARMQQRRDDLQQKLSKKKQDNMEANGGKKQPPGLVFQKRFDESRNKILELLPKMGAENSKANLEIINGLVDLMRKHLAEATRVISGYDRRRAVIILRDLLDKIRQKIIEVNPEIEACELKKFQFCDNEKLIDIELNKTDSVQESDEEKLSKADIPKSDVPKWWEESDRAFKIFGLVGQTIEIGPECDGFDISLSRLNDCKISIKGIASTVYASYLKNCTIVAYPVSTSIFAENCDSCTFCLACQQLRIHTCSDCEFYAHVSSRAVMEHSKKLKFAPYALKPAENVNLTALFVGAGLNFDSNNWNSVNDFDWPLKNKPSPNWSIIDCDSRRDFFV